MSPITSTDFANQTPGQSLCEAFQEKLLNNSSMQKLLDYWFSKGDGNLAAGFLGDLLNFVTPIGSVVWHPQTLSNPTPDNGAQWIEANNQRLSQTDYARLYSVYGLFYAVAGDGPTDFRVPDLGGLSLLGRGTYLADPATITDPLLNRGSYLVGTRGGEATHALLDAECGNPQTHVHVTGRQKSASGGDNNNYALATTTMTDDALPSIVPAISGSGGITDNLGSLTGQYFGTSPAHGPVAKVAPTDADSTTIQLNPHNNLPPYVVGVYYILAGFKANGVMV